jgi:hypothetical protein
VGHRNFFTHFVFDEIIDDHRSQRVCVKDSGGEADEFFKVFLTH